MTKTDIDYYDDAIRRHTTIPADKLAQIRADYEERKRKAEEKLAIDQTLMALRTFSDPPFTYVKTDNFTAAERIDVAELSQPEIRAAYVASMQEMILKRIAGREVVRIEALVERVVLENTHQLVLTVYVRSVD